MRRTPIARSRTPIRARRRTPDYDAAAWREGLGPCVVTEATEDVDPHHVVYAQTLRAHGLREFLGDHRNRLSLVRDVHLNHHSGVAPIPREILPAAVFEFAAEVGLTWWLDKHYPVAVDA